MNPEPGAPSSRSAMPEPSVALPARSEYCCVAERLKANCPLACPMLPEPRMAYTRSNPSLMVCLPCVMVMLGARFHWLSVPHVYKFVVLPNRSGNGSTVNRGGNSLVLFGRGFWRVI